MAKKSKGKGLSLYANLAARRRSKADAKARRKAEYLATLPKQPLKRLLYRLHPKRVIKFWFSKQGAITFLKLVGVGIIILTIFIAALFAYYRRELDAFSPDQLAKSVQTTVTKYLDRNGQLLWEDKGDGNYKLVVNSDEIANVMKQATISIEDKDFYKHGGISVTGIIRATLSNITGGGEVQGASTLTQQLIKQVFFAQDSQSNRLDIGRKIKEAILAIEVERMYTKDQILNLYLNEVPYGGRRNGVESAAETYFGIHAKDLNLAQSALIASIPQNPNKYNPYTLTSQASKDLITRQHLVLDDMQQQGYITQQQADDAKKVPILDTIKPELSADEDIKAPWFVLAVRQQLEDKFGTKVVREGGLTVKTTLDWRIEEQAINSINTNFKYAQAINANNMALSAIDVPTGQVLAMVGSHDYHDLTLGAVNAAMADLNPGSSIKPFIYANLMKPQANGTNWGAGSILVDEPVKSTLGVDVQNYDGKFKGPLPIRSALGMSRNPPALEAAHIGGLDNAIQTAKDAGDTKYCNGIDYGITAAIGTCQVTVVQHTNAYATLARNGVYKPESYVLQVTNAQGQTLMQWQDNQSKKVLDPQITYILDDILNDDNARSPVFGHGAAGFNVPGVKTATKTGTTDDGNGHAKDSWMMSYTPRMAVGIWTGRNEGGHLTALSSTGNQKVITDVQQFAHTQIFAKDGSWKTGDWFARPSGVQTLTVGGRSDIFPSWYKNTPSSNGDQITFDQVSKKKATDCTPEAAKTTLTIQSYKDPLTGQTTYSDTNGYDPNSSDDVHKCDDIKPYATISTSGVGKTITITVTPYQGTFPLSSLTVSVDGQQIANQAVGASGTPVTLNYTFTSSGDHTITATVSDQGMYSGTASSTKTISYIEPSSSPLPLQRYRQTNSAG